MFLEPSEIALDAKEVGGKDEGLVLIEPPCAVAAAHAAEKFALNRWQTTPRA